MCCCFNDTFKGYNSKTSPLKNVLEMKKMDSEFKKNVSRIIKDSAS